MIQIRPPWPRWLILSHLCTCATAAGVRISTKLAVTLAVTSALILCAYGARQLLQEKGDLQASAEHELRLLGVAIQVAVENALRDQQAADVREILESLELRDSAVDVLIFEPDGRVSMNSWGSAPSTGLVAPLVPEVIRTRRPIVRFLGPTGLSQLVAVMPLRADDGSVIGVAAVVRPLEALRHDLEATAVSILSAIASVFAALIVVTWLLIQLYLRRPLASLVGAIRAVRRGDLGAAAAQERSDELGEIAAEFNAMVRELRTAQQRAAEEIEARRKVEAGLARVDKLVTLGQLSAGLAHEIGSPLQILNGRARALAARPDVSADVRRTAEILAEQSDRITSIVEQLLSFARRKAPHLAETDLAAEVAKIVELLAAEARRRGVQLSLSVDAELPATPADGEQVQQVAMNLLTNALRATPPGGRVCVTVAASSFVSPVAARSEPSVSFTIENTGPGIAPELMPRIFEPFFTTWQDAGGTGLGLAVVKAIVTEHRGAVSVASDPDRGTRFTVHFPVHASLPAVEEQVA